MRIGVAAAMVAGLSISALLLRQSLSTATSVPGCGPGSSCDAVLGSAWSTVAGVPVSALAVGLYGLMLGAWLNIRARAPIRSRRVAWGALIAGSVLLLGAAAWFVALQLVVIGAVCPWCMAAHACGAAVAGLVLAAAPIGPTRLIDDEPADPMMIGPARAGGLAALGLLPLLALIGAQAASRPPGASVATFGGVTGRPVDLPMLGDRDAPHVLLYLFDYTCPLCRALHAELPSFVDRYDGAIAIAFMPVPLDAACNPLVAQTDAPHRGACELAKLSLATWRASPGDWPAMHAMLMSLPAPPPTAQARERASRFGAVLDAWPADQIARNVELYRVTGGGPLPKFIAGQVIVAGAGSVDVLAEILDRELGLSPRDGRGPAGTISP